MAITLMMIQITEIILMVITSKMMMFTRQKIIVSIKDSKNYVGYDDADDDTDYRDDVGD